MIKGTYAEQKIKDAIQKLKEASFLIEDIAIESISRICSKRSTQDENQITDGEWVMIGDVKADIIECAMQLKEFIGE